MRALLLAWLLLALAPAAVADPVPYRVWWSFPNDDDTAIEIDDPDLSVSKWDGERWKFAVAMQKCDAKRSKQLAQHKDGTPVRELRVDALEPGGKVRASARCVMTLSQWRARIGRELVYRLDDELDAHAAFLMPRRGPGMSARSPLSPDGGATGAGDSGGAGTRGAGSGNTGTGGASDEGSNR